MPSSFALKIKNPYAGITGWPQNTEMMIVYSDLTCSEAEADALSRYKTFEDLLTVVVAVTNLGAARDCGSSADTNSDGDFQGAYSLP